MIQLLNGLENSPGFTLDPDKVKQARCITYTIGALILLSLPFLLKNSNDQPVQNTDQASPAIQKVAQ